MALSLSLSVSLSLCLSLSVCVCRCRRLLASTIEADRWRQSPGPLLSSGARRNRRSGSGSGRVCVPRAVDDGCSRDESAPPSTKGGAAVARGVRRRLGGRRHIEAHLQRRGDMLASLLDGERLHRRRRWTCARAQGGAQWAARRDQAGGIWNRSDGGPRLAEVTAVTIHVPVHEESGKLILFLLICCNGVGCRQPEEHGELNKGGRGAGRTAACEDCSTAEGPQA